MPVAELGPLPSLNIQRPDRRLTTRRILGEIPEFLARCRVIEIIKLLMLTVVSVGNGQPTKPDDAEVYRSKGATGKPACSGSGMHCASVQNATGVTGIVRTEVLMNSVRSADCFCKFGDVY